MQHDAAAGVWTTNLAALLIGFGMYSAFILIPQFVQTPTSTGYGFGASVSQAGLFLVPTTIAMLIFSPIGGRLSGRRRLEGAAGRGHGVTTSSRSSCSPPRGSRGRSTSPRRCSGSESGSRSPSLANLIVEAVRPDQTGVASGMNTIVRTIGGAIGAEVAASILAANARSRAASRTSTATPSPSRSARAVLGVGVARLARRPGPPPRRRRRGGSIRRRLGASRHSL